MDWQADYAEAHARFLAAVVARDRLEADWWLCAMKQAVAEGDAVADLEAWGKD